MTEPTVRPTGGNRKPASPETGGDSFTKVLDAEMAAVEGNVAVTQLLPAPVSTPAPKAAVLEVSAVAAQVPVAGGEEAFAVALANVASSAAASPPDAPDVQIAVTDAAVGETVLPSPTNPAPAAQVTQAVQASGVAAVLAVSSGIATTDGEAQQSASVEESAKAESDGETVAVASGFNVPQPAPIAPASVVTGAQAAAPQTESVAPAAAPVAPAGSSAATPTTPDLAGAQPETPAPQADAQPASQASLQPVTAKATQPAAQSQAAAVESATKTTTDNAVAAPSVPQTTAQSAAMQAPTDASRAVATPPALQSAPAAAVQVYTRIIERADGRAQRFEVRLDPAELGRVDVRIEIGADRKVHAVLAVHDSAALTDLMRGQRALERALTGAGLDLADNGVRFELAADSGRGNANQQQAQDGNGRSGQPNVWRNFNAVSVPVTPEAAEAATNAWRPQRLDLVA